MACRTEEMDQFAAFPKTPELIDQRSLAALRRRRLAFKLLVFFRPLSAPMMQAHFVEAPPIMTH